jgi:hypothetical protein
MSSEYEFTLSLKTLEKRWREGPGRPGEGQGAGRLHTGHDYSNHLFHTPLDGMFAKREWKETAASI